MKAGMDMSKTDVGLSNSLTDLAARINEAHHLAMHHAGKAIAQAIACGQMLLEAKSKVGHGQWLPRLRQNVTFGERSAQGYMRLAERAPKLNEGSTIRDALKELATPRRHWREALDAECELWTAHTHTLRANRPENVSDWSHQDAKNCADIIRGYDAIFHKYGICDQEDCLVCDALGLNGPEYIPPEPFASALQAEANTQHVADLVEGE
jgi:Protein of unknown function (DUF3102)